MLKIKNNTIKLKINMGKVGRPKGSIKKKNEGKKMEVMKFYDYQGSPVMKDNTLYGIVNFGSDNLFPNKILDLYGSSVTFNSCVNFTVNAVFGNGIDYSKITDEIPRPNPNEDWDTFIRKIIFDIVLFDSFSIQIIKTKGTEQYVYYHQPVLNVRLEQPDEEGKVNHAYISADWSKPAQYPPIALPMYHFDENEKINRGEIYIYYYHRYNPQNSLYGIPSFCSVLNQIQAEAQFQTYDHKSIVNGFTAAGALSLPAVETDMERNEILKQITNMFTGENNASNLLIQFRTNDEDRGVEYTPFSIASDSVDLYSNSNERVMNRILAAFRISSRGLVGYAMEETGFSNSGEFLQAAYNLFKINVANNIRLIISEAIDQMLQLNGYDAEIEFTDLNYMLETNEDVDVEKEENNEEGDV